MKRYFLVLLGVGGLGVCRVLEAWGLNYSVFFKTGALFAFWVQCW